MNKPSLETIGIRYTGWAALNRDPLDDRVEYTCPQCGAQGKKAARRPRSAYHFTDGFIQDLQGEADHGAADRRQPQRLPYEIEKYPR